MVSHRSGETEDTFISDLVVGLCTGQVDTHTHDWQVERETGRTSNQAESIQEVRQDVTETGREDEIQVT